MSTDSWDDRRRAQEEQFFAKQNEAAMLRLKARAVAKDNTKSKRLSPVTGEPMIEQTIMGVVVDQCPTSGGVWLDAGELQQLLSASTTAGEHKSGWIESFVGRLTKSR